MASRFDLLNIISLTWNNENSRRNLAEKPVNFAGSQLLYATLHSSFNIVSDQASSTGKICKRKLWKSDRSCEAHKNWPLLLFEDLPIVKWFLCYHVLLPNQLQFGLAVTKTKWNIIINNTDNNITKHIHEKDGFISTKTHSHFSKIIVVTEIKVLILAKIYLFGHMGWCQRHGLKWYTVESVFLLQPTREINDNLILKNT